jgi:hypothetical protein
VVSPTNQRFLKPQKGCDILKNGDDITTIPPIKKSKIHPLQISAKYLNR